MTSAPNAASRWTRLPLVLLLGLTFLLGCFELSDTDVWWHLRTGELIPQLGVPKKDWYTFKSADEEWIDVHWGFQLVAAILHTKYGAAGLVVMKATMGLLTMCAALTAYRREWPTTVQVLVWIPGVLMMSSRFYERPEVFTLFFTGVFLAVLFHAENHPRLLWVLPIVQAIWANFQGLFAFGPILLGMYWLEAILRMDRVRGLFRHLMPATLCVFAACLASPYGWKNILLVFQISQTATRARYRDTIAELQSIPKFFHDTGYNSPHLWLLLAMIGAAGASVLAAWRTVFLERRVFRVLPAAAFGYLGFQALRNGSHCALVCGVVACWNFGSISWRPRSVRPTFLLNTLLLLAASYFVGSERWHLFTNPQRKLGFGERERYYAHDAMRYAGQPGMPDRVLLYHNGFAPQYTYANFDPATQRKVYTDARLEVQSEKTYEQYQTLEKWIKEGDSRWDRQLRADGVDLVGADGENHEIQAGLLAEPGWLCVYYDEIYALFLREEHPLPPGVQAVDFHKAAFEDRTAPAELPGQPTARPHWWLFPPANYGPNEFDLLGARGTYLATALAAKSTAPASLRHAILWRSLRAGIRAVDRRRWSAECYRNLAQTAWALAGRNRSVLEPWTAVDGVFSAIAVHSFRLATQADQWDFSSNYYLGQLYKAMGATDLSLRRLERIDHALPRSKTQRDLLSDQKITQETSAMRTALAASRIELGRDRGAGSDFAALERAAERGLLGEALQRFNEREAAAAFSELQMDRVGTWLLCAGEVERARALYESAVGLTFDSQFREHRLGCCALVAGRWREAKSRFDKIVAPTWVVEAAWCSAVLRALEGDVAGARKHAAVGLSAHPEPREMHALQYLLEILPERAQ